MLDITETTYVEALWFAPFADRDADVMVFISREDGDPKWKMEMRFKYYASPDPFDKKDRRNGYYVKDENLAKLLKTVEGLYALGYKEGHLRHHEKITIQAKGEAAADKMIMAASTHDWIHIKQEKVKP